MPLLTLLKKIYTGFNNRIIFNPEAKHPSIEEQKAFLASFPNPTDDFDRSFYKYQCVEFYHYNYVSKIILNTLSTLAILFFIPFYLIKGFFSKTSLDSYKAKDIMISKSSKRIPITDIFPEKLKEEYSAFIEVENDNYSSYVLTKPGVTIFFKALWKHINKPHYLLVLLIRLSQYCWLISKYQPACITTYVCEREFSDPLITYMCENLGIKYEAFMHGDYLYTVCNSFMRYSRYWVWDEHYKKMFRKQRCEQDMEIYQPIKYSGIAKQINEIEEPEFFLTYYCSGETHESMDIIQSIFKIIEKKGKKCKIRPHPRFSDLKYIEKAFKNFVIEDTFQVSIADSIKSTLYSAAIVSTVLSQAYYSGAKIIIDDCSRKDYFELIKNSDYIMLDKADMLLSELVAELLED